MFISLIAELVIGVYGGEYFLTDVYFATVLLGASFVNDILNSVAEIGELNIELESLVSRLDALNARLETITSVLSLVSDLPYAGASAEGITAVLQVLVTLNDAISLVTDVVGLLSRGANLLAVVAENNSLTAFNLTGLDTLSFGLRPVSLALRLFANLTSGVLLSGLSTRGSITFAVATLVTSVLGIDLSAAAAITVVLSGFESVVGIIQSFVYYLLVVQYYENVLNY